MLIGSVGALVTWGLNSIGVQERSSGSIWGALAAAVLVGAGGGRVLTDESKRVLQEATEKNLEDAVVVEELHIEPRVDTREEY